MEGRKEIVGLRDREDEGGLVESEDESCSVDEDEEVSENSKFGSEDPELTEDPSSSSSSSSSSSFSGPLFEFSEVMANLPIKRGLSRYYDGKSQSFMCLGSATSLEDLIKKDCSPYKKRMKSCKSCAANIGSDPRHHYHCITGRSYSPKATIAKKVSKINSLLPPPTGKRVNSIGSTVGR